MQTKIYLPNFAGAIATYNGVGTPIGADTLLQCLTEGEERGDSFIYLPLDSGICSIGCFPNYDFTIPLDSVLNEISATMVWTVNENAVGGLFACRFYNSVTEINNNIELGQPTNPTESIFPPVAANYEHTNAVSTLPWTISDLQNGSLYWGARFSPPLGFNAEIGYWTDTDLIVKFTLAAPIVGTTIGTPSSTLISVSTPLTVGNVNGTYPITHHYQWTDTDPILGGPIFDAPTGIIVGDGSTTTLPLGVQTINQTLPISPFTWTANSTHWVRLVAVNADNTVYGNWAALTTSTGAASGSFDPILI